MGVLKHPTLEPNKNGATIFHMKRDQVTSVTSHYGDINAHFSLGFFISLFLKENMKHIKRVSEYHGTITMMIIQH